jgi:4-diphosphocytidyl-2C-methyl-D-erythritol kinase
MSTGKRVSLFLRDVPAIDEAGRSLLRRLAERGVRLLGSGAYVAQVIETLHEARKAKKTARAARSESRRA